MLYIYHVLYITFYWKRTILVKVVKRGNNGAWNVQATTWFFPLNCIACFQTLYVCSANISLVSGCTWDLNILLPVYFEPPIESRGGEVLIIAARAILILDAGWVAPAAAVARHPTPQDCLSVFRAFGTQSGEAAGRGPVDSTSPQR